MYESLKDIKDAVVHCKNCNLYLSRKLPVVGQGNHEAPIMFIGDAPSKEDSNTGIPYSNGVGDLLDERLQEIGWKREDVYLCNIVKCSPPNDRDPEEIEKAMCFKYLVDQINLINPKIIVPMGRHATISLLTLFNLEDQVGLMGQMHGREILGKANVFVHEDKVIFPIYHPSAALHRSSILPELKQDFIALNLILNKYAILPR